jgi:hypothetical protein
LSGLHAHLRTAPARISTNPAEHPYARVRVLLKRLPAFVAFALAASLAAFLTNDLLRMPLQVPDSLTLILDAAQSPSPWATFTNYLNNAGYFRPFFYLQNKVLFDLSAGHVAIGAESAARSGYHRNLVVQPKSVKNHVRSLPSPGEP